MVLDREKMKEHEQVFLKVFKIQIVPGNKIFVNCIGNKADITDVLEWDGYHIKICISF